MSAEHDGYSPVCIRRTVEVRGANVVITDEVDGKQDAMTSWHLPFAGVEAGDRPTVFRLQSGTSVRIEASAPLKSVSIDYSPAYGILAQGTEVCSSFESGLVTTITILRGVQ